MFKAFLSSGPVSVASLLCAASSCPGRTETEAGPEPKSTALCTASFSASIRHIHGRRCAGSVASEAGIRMSRGGGAD